MLNDQIELLESFNAHGVEYLVVGGHAVSLHATPRATKDLDVWVGSDARNGEAVFRALASFGAPLGTLSSSDFSGNADVVFQIGVEPNRVDILQTLSGVRFAEAWSRRVPGLMDGRVPVYFLSADDLIANKLSVGRPRDLGDVDEIRRVLKGTEK